MYSIFDIVAYIGTRYKHGRAIEVLCYYSKVFYMIIYNKELFHDEFVAGVYGPECSAFEERFSRISYSHFDISLIKEAVHIDAQTRQFLDCIMDTFSSLSVNELLSSVRCEIPWILARNGLDCYDLDKPDMKTIDALEYYDEKLFSSSFYSSIVDYYNKQRMDDGAPLRVFCIGNVTNEKVYSYAHTNNWRIVCSAKQDCNDASIALPRCLSADIVIFEHAVSDSNLYLVVAKAMGKKIIFAD